DADPVVIANVDQPRPRELLRDLLDQHRDAGSAVTEPVGGGRRRHPVVVAGALLPELRNASEEELGLRGVLAAHEDAVLEVHLASPLVLVDINTPEDYERALSAFGLAGRDLPP
ncbi:MAG: NTP transferase domain-containing protein, partial [Dehalococcoidia bacterium]|nr:NTP transferase domain-containing protein [Dehalococcoidia bacterium]